jgi:hypothetical protein
VSEWIGWVSRLRRAIYARMEALSFRTGTATVAGVIAVAVTAILLTLIQGGHHAALRTTAEASAAPSSAVAAAPVAVFPPPADHSAPPSRGAAPFAVYVPKPGKSRTATPQPDPSPTVRPTRRSLLREPSGKHSPGSQPSEPGGWPLPSPPTGWQYDK